MNPVILRRTPLPTLDRRQPLWSLVAPEAARRVRHSRDRSRRHAGAAAAFAAAGVARSGARDRPRPSFPRRRASVAASGGDRSACTHHRPAHRAPPTVHAASAPPGLALSHALDDGAALHGAGIPDAGGTSADVVTGRDRHVRSGARSASADRPRGAWLPAHRAPAHRPHRRGEFTQLVESCFAVSPGCRIPQPHGSPPCGSSRAAGKLSAIATATSGHVAPRLRAVRHVAPELTGYRSAAPAAAGLASIPAAGTGIARRGGRASRSCAAQLTTSRSRTGFRKESS
jgi:hypothetical protein